MQFFCFPRGSLKGLMGTRTIDNVKLIKRIYFLAGFSLSLAILQGVLYGYAAYVTRFTIHALQLTGSDLEKFSEAMRKQIHLSVDGFIIAGCQVALIVFARRFNKFHPQGSETIQRGEP